MCASFLIKIYLKQKYITLHLNWNIVASKTNSFQIRQIDNINIIKIFLGM